ncbi:MAG: hypothetical protein LBT97_00505, partial [Planctomycetota bacterium]|nr:hypothetical protein [Planctomycetota bacterium]
MTGIGVSVRIMTSFTSWAFKPPNAQFVKSQPLRHMRFRLLPSGDWRFDRHFAKLRMKQAPARRGARERARLFFHEDECFSRRLSGAPESSRNCRRKKPYFFLRRPILSGNIGFGFIAPPPL